MVAGFGWSATGACVKPEGLRRAANGQTVDDVRSFDEGLSCIRLITRMFVWIRRLRLARLRYRGMPGCVSFVFDGRLTGHASKFGAVVAVVIVVAEAGVVVALASGVGCGGGGGLLHDVVVFLAVEGASVA